MGKHHLNFTPAHIYCPECKKIVLVDAFYTANLDHYYCNNSKEFHAITICKNKRIYKFLQSDIKDPIQFMMRCNFIFKECSDTKGV